VAVFMSAEALQVRMQEDYALQWIEED